MLRPKTTACFWSLPEGQYHACPLLDSRASRSHDTQANPQGAKPRRRMRLDVEALESRVTPSTTPSATLQLIPPTGPGGRANPLTLNLDSYSFGFTNPVSIGSNVTGAGAGKAAFNDLIVTTPLNAKSPTLFLDLAGALSFSQATLTQNNAAGKPVAVWILKPVNLDSDKVDGVGSATPEETIQFKFRAVTETTNVNTQYWDQIGNTVGTPSPLPTGVTLDPLPTPPATAATLQLYSATSAVPAITIAVDSYQFMFEHPTTVGSAAAQKGGGLPTKLDTLDISTSFSTDSPALLKALTTGAITTTRCSCKTTRRGRRPPPGS